MIIHVVEMLRWGDAETHHYIIGAFTRREDADLAGDAERSFRGGKYEYRVVEVELDTFNNLDAMEYHKSC